MTTTTRQEMRAHVIRALMRAYREAYPVSVGTTSDKALANSIMQASRTPGGRDTLALLPACGGMPSSVMASILQELCIIDHTEADLASARQENEMHAAMRSDAMKAMQEKATSHEARCMNAAARMMLTGNDKGEGRRSAWPEEAALSYFVHRTGGAIHIGGQLHNRTAKSHNDAMQAVAQEFNKPLDTIKRTWKRHECTPSFDAPAYPVR